MERALWKEHLALAEQHVAQAEKHIARQREIVAKIELAGRDAASARNLLRLFQDTLAIFNANRDRLRKQLGLPPLGEADSSSP